MKKSLQAGSLFLVSLLAASTPLSAAGNKNLCVLGEPTAESHTWDFDGEADEILAETSRHAFHVRQRAAMLQALASPSSRWSTDSHWIELMEIRNRVNAMAEDACRMAKISQAVEPWRQQMLDKTAERIGDLATAAENAIANFNEWPKRHSRASAYNTLVDDIHDQAAALRSMTKRPAEGDFTAAD